MVWGILLGVTLILLSICIFAVLRVVQSSKHKTAFELEPIKQQISELTATIDSTVFLLENCLPLSEQEALLKTQADLEAEIKSLENKQSAKKTSLLENSSLLESKSQELIALKSDCEHFAQLAQSLEKQTDATEQERERLLAELEQSSTQIKALTEEAALSTEQKEKLTGLQELIESFRRKLETTSKNYAAAAKQFSELQTQYMSLEKELARLQEKQLENVSPSPVEQVTP